MRTTLVLLGLLANAFAYQLNEDCVCKPGNSIRNPSWEDDNKDWDFSGCKGGKVIKDDSNDRNDDGSNYGNNYGNKDGNNYANSEGSNGITGNKKGVLEVRGAQESSPHGSSHL